MKQYSIWPEYQSLETWYLDIYPWRLSMKLLTAPQWFTRSRFFNPISGLRMVRGWWSWYPVWLTFCDPNHFKRSFDMRNFPKFLKDFFRHKLWNETPDVSIANYWVQGQTPTNSIDHPWRILSFPQEKNTRSWTPALLEWPLRLAQW